MSNRRPKKILIVEDEPDIAQLVKLYLEKDGFRASVAKSGVEALTVIKSGIPDLLILDLMLPEIDGIEVCKRLRNTPDTALLPIIMLTAKSEESDTIIGLELGAFTSKPDIKQANLSTRQEFTFTSGTTTECLKLGTRCPQVGVNNGTLNVRDTSLRVAGLTANVIARYPGKWFQPYAGIGGGVFYFTSSGQFEGRQYAPGLNVMGGLKLLATEQWGLFVEGRYNFSYLSNFDPAFGLS